MEQLDMFGRKKSKIDKFKEIISFKLMFFLAFIPFLIFEVVYLSNLIPKDETKSGFEVINLSSRYSGYKLSKDNDSTGNLSAISKNGKRLFVTDFKGNTTASGVKNIKEVINMIILNYKKDDEVVISLESPGGSVTGYGYLSSEIARLKEHNIPTTIIVDEVAASGGYMAAVVGDKIVAAPFAMVGSIGVVAQVPIVEDFLKKFGVNYKTYTAGVNKRNVTPFKNPTASEEEKMNEFLASIHGAFKDHIKKNRPNVDVEVLGDGSVFLGEKAKELGLVDEIGTRDDYLVNKYIGGYDIYQIQYYASEETQTSIINSSIDTFTSMLVDKLVAKLSQDNTLSNIH